MGKGIAAAPVSAGASHIFVAAGAGAKTYGGYTFATGISDLQLALRTPDGMEASSMKSLEAEIASRYGVDEKGQKMIEIALGIITGNIGKNLANGEVVRALIQSGRLSSDIIDLMEILYEEAGAESAQSEDLRETHSSSNTTTFYCTESRVNDGASPEC